VTGRRMTDKNQVLCPMLCMLLEAVLHNSLLYIQEAAAVEAGYHAPTIPFCAKKLTGQK